MITQKPSHPSHPTDAGGSSATSQGDDKRAMEEEPPAIRDRIMLFQAITDAPSSTPWATHPT
jgi:hypothetical protein